MAESTPLEDVKTKKKGSHCRYFKTKVIEQSNSEKINETIQEHIDEKSIVLSVKATNYIDISEYVETHINENQIKKQPLQP